MGREDTLGRAYNPAMPRVTEEAFEEGSQIVRVYMAASVAEAQRVEKVLDDLGLEYLAEPEQYGAPHALGSRTRTGVGIWVPEAALDPAADALERAGLRSGLVKR
jgi:hypothetical protein